MQYHAKIYGSKINSVITPFLPIRLGELELHSVYAVLFGHTFDSDLVLSIIDAPNSNLCSRK